MKGIDERATRHRSKAFGSGVKVTNSELADAGTKSGAKDAVKGEAIEAGLRGILGRKKP